MNEDMEEAADEECSASAARDDKETYLMEDPNAIKHMDALFEVLKVRCKPKVPDTPSYNISEDTTPYAKILDALFAVINKKQDASDSDTANTKSWKDRELPPSFFDAGSISGGHERDSTASPESPELQEMASSSSPPSTAEDDAVVQPPSSPVVVVATRDCLTYYVDKHLQCSVNLEPPTERRRRLARDRVKKYRTKKRRQRRPVVNSKPLRPLGDLRIIKIESICS